MIHALESHIKCLYCSFYFSNQFFEEYVIEGFIEFNVSFHTFLMRSSHQIIYTVYNKP